MPNALIASQNGNGHQSYAEADAGRRAKEEDLPKAVLLNVAEGLLFDDLAKDAALRHEAHLTKKPLGPLTSFPGLDRCLGGALMPGLHIVHGSPGVGKTAFALQVAADCQCPAMFVTCEMPPIELLRRIIARTTRTYLGSLKDGSRTPTNVLHLARKAAAQVQMLTILDATQAPASVEDLYTALDTTRAKSPGNPHALIIVDSLHSWAEGLGGTGEEYDRINEACAALRKVAAKLVIPIL
ncbi:MAG: DnaB-like helicase C-terminal domain-containing protein, partial [Armatimonadota bacterium]